MEKKNNVIRLTEAELHQLIEAAVNESMDEINWKGAAKKVGKGLAKGALYGAMATAGTGAGLYCLDKGLENQERYEQNLNRQAARMNCDPVRDYMERTGCSYEEAEQMVGDADPEEYYDYYHPQTNESKKAAGNILSEENLARVIRQNLKKILG